MTLRLLVVMAAFTFAACEPPAFRHDIAQAPFPWTATPEKPEDRKFTFAIIGDLYSGERSGVFPVAIEQLNMMRPDIVLSVGDLIDGGTEDTVTLAHQFDHFDERIARLQAPFFRVVGNHDITNLAMRTYWEQRYGKRYYHIVYQDVLFLMLDSEDYDSARMMEIYQARAEAIRVLDGPNPERARQMAYFNMRERATGEIGAKQAAYFEKVIRDNPSVRWTFLLMHKPVYKNEKETDFRRILTALQNKPYTVINGHFHEYAYSENEGKDYIMMATTSGHQNELNAQAFDHFLWVTMEDKPHMINLRMDGLLDKTGHIPLGGDTLCFQASRCRGEESFH
jgi:predicted phosphodiesterase